MLNANSQIVFRWRAKCRDVAGLPEKSIRVIPVSRWISYLIIVPAGLAAVALTAFALSVFLAVLLIAGTIIGVSVWSLRRKLLKINRNENLEGEYVAVKKAVIVEPVTGKQRDIEPDRACDGVVR